MSIVPASAAATELTRQACWICGGSDTILWKRRNLQRPLSPEDLQITDSRYGVTLALRRCRQCGFIFAEASELPELTRLYEQLEDQAYGESQDSRALQMKWLLDQALTAHPGARSLLDLGAGAGLLVVEARRRGLDATGVEPSRWLVQMAADLHGVALHQGIFPHPALAGRTFDVISLIEVIEHVSNPVALLADCSAALAEGGILMLVTPDARSLAARLLGRRWWHFRLAHVGYFHRRSLAAALRQAGLEPIQWMRAKWFFRIGYLAERLERYLPVRGLNRRLRKRRALVAFYERVIPLALRDSFYVLCRKRAR